LPRTSIARTDIGDKIVFQENPRLAGLGAGQQAKPGAAPHLLRMHLEEGRGLLEVKRIHD
jgi:hypothetical protein